MKIILNERDVPEGYDLEAEYRFLRYGDSYIDSDKVFTEIREWSGVRPSVRKYIVVSPKKWRAAVGETYYYICISSSAHVSNRIDYRAPIDKNRYCMGNYYRTKEKAIAALVKIKKAF